MAEEDTTTDDTSIEQTSEESSSTPDDEVAKWKALARKHEREAKRLKVYEEQAKTEADKAIERARAEAAEEAKKEVSATYNARVLRAEVKAAAKGRMSNPDLALRLLDLDDFEVDDDGEVDATAIAKAIEKLIEENPGLAAKGGQPRGDIDQGRRGTAPVSDMNSIIRRHAGVGQ